MENPQWHELFSMLSSPHFWLQFAAFLGALRYPPAASFGQALTSILSVSPSNTPKDPPSCPGLKAGLCPRLQAQTNRQPPSNN